MQMEYKFKGEEVVEGSETPLKEKTIQKTGHIIEFTLSGVEQNEAQYENNIKALKSAIEVEDAKMKNIESHHPDVLNLAEELKIAAQLHQNAKVQKAEFEAQLKIQEEASKELSDEKAEILKQLQIDDDTK